ncbi:MAG TPA: GNAT family N-acetyltransferase [Solirubrobacteraceae bacterium]|nr:GNAT family N-acetyltransferase [Solirubrobacteraceae bacterium]
MVAGARRPAARPTRRPISSATVTDFRLVVTDRLELSATDPARDLDGLFPIWSDPASWEHAPEYRHTEARQTLDWLRRSAARWRTDGLSYWTARLRGTDTVVGSGGVARRATGSWNLLWRLDPRQRGRGLATELGRAALDAAHAADPGSPVIAWIRSSNHSSRRLAERLGLVEHSERVDESDGVTRIPYADRALTSLPWIGS